MATIITKEYKKWFAQLKSTIKQNQIKASQAVNSELIYTYWRLGKEINDKQKNAKWGSGFINQLSTDLRLEFPNIGGFSADNLRYCKIFYDFWENTLSFDTISEQAVRKLKASKNVISEQAVRKLENSKTTDWIRLVGQVPWGHHLLILKKIKLKKTAQFYISHTVENGWSRAVLEYQIETKLHKRQGKAITNFKNTLPAIDSDLANTLLKDPYNFGFLNLTKHVKEQELEQKLVANITHFLLELGKGFAYLGKQFTLRVGGKDFRTDLLFYHTKLKCYIIIELKVTEFEPEYLGKLNFYITAIDKKLKDPSDNETIGILLCKNKNNVIVDFALNNINKPIGVSEYSYRQLPKNIKQELPTAAQLTAQLNIDDDEN